MKPLLLKVNENAASSFDLRYEKVPYFDNPWHYHPEFELTLVVKSSGIRFIGDNISPFEAGDLVLLGSNLPHYWRNSEQYYKPNIPPQAEAIIMRFRIELWGKDIIETPEMYPVKQLLQRAEKGIQFSPKTAEQIMPILHKLLKEKGLRRLMGWLEVFEVLVSRADNSLISNKSFGGTNPKQDSNRMDTILSYVQEHLAEPIHLIDVAALAHMNKAAFCRYFKQQTHKTFTEVLNEIRIQSACRLLADSGKDIGQIAYQCGFQDISYFNQVFKAKKGVTPSAFRTSVLS